MSASPTDRNAVQEAAADDAVLVAFCDRARMLFERQQARAQQLEADLTRHIETAMEEINFSHAVAEESDEQIGQLDQRLAKLSRERDQALEARSDAESLLDEARVAISQVSREQHDLRVQLSQCHKQLNARADELKELRVRLRASSGRPSSDLSEELSRLESERNVLRDELDDARRRLADASCESSVDATELETLRKRFETAVQEIRELKRRNNELNDRLADLRMGSKQLDEGHVGGFDWEAQKRRLMMQLDSDFDESADGQTDKLTVEGTIRITDQVIAEKDREIEELKRLLQDQSSSIGDVAVGAAAIAGFLDQDELIREERESLKRLQEEWREKLRQAEIDISVERARLGRERSDLQGQMQTIDRQRQAHEADGGKLDDKQPRGLWRKRLGLKDD